MTLRQNRNIALLDDIIDPSPTHKKNIFKIEQELLERDRPKVWNIHATDNMERVIEVDFHKFGVAVADASGQQLKNMTTFTFYATVLHLKEKNSPNKNN